MINLFRRGPSGSARVHYRDGSIGTVARDEVHTFLQNLDDIEASRIRHMEIERTCHASARPPSSTRPASTPSTPSTS